MPCAPSGGRSPGCRSPIPADALTSEIEAAARHGSNGTVEQATADQSMMTILKFPVIS